MMLFFASLSNAELIALTASVLAFMGSIWANINSYRATTLARKMRISEFNKSKLDSLRNEIASLVGLSDTIVMANLLANDRMSALEKSKGTDSTNQIRLALFEVLHQRDQGLIQMANKYQSIRLDIDESEAPQKEILRLIHVLYEETVNAISENQPVTNRMRTITELVSISRAFLRSKLNSDVFANLNNRKAA
jgi:hypothetical protein